MALRPGRPWPQLFAGRQFDAELCGLNRSRYLTLHTYIRNNMATVHVGSVWTLQDCMGSSLPIKGWPRKSYPGDLRSGQFRDLPIKSLWGNIQFFPFCIKQSKPRNSFRVIATHPFCYDTGQLMMGFTGRPLTWSRLRSQSIVRPWLVTGWG